MLKKILVNQKGLTFIELMIAIAIIVLISAISVVYIKGDIFDEVDMVTDQLAADIRFTRSLAVSRTTYDFGGGAGLEYPSGGYGIHINQLNDTYTIFAESGASNGYDAGDGVVKAVTLENNLIKLGDAHEDRNVTTSYFTFKSETEAVTNLRENTYGKYQMEIDFPNGGEWPDKGYRGILTLGEVSDDGLVLVSLGKKFEEYEYNEPSPKPYVDPADKIRREVY